MPWSTLVLMLSACLLMNRIDASEQDIQPPIRIGSWNLQRFGQAKMDKDDVVAIIVEVIRRYDIMVVLEVTDISGESQKELLKALNHGITDQSEAFDMISSERLGRASYKEQYVYYWKPDRVSYKSNYQYQDLNDVIQFEPFIAIFEAQHLKFGVLPIHTKPSDAVKEIDGLVDVYDAFSANSSVKDVIIIGDFNSGCTYVTANDYDNIRLWTDFRFTWLISDRTDTTVKQTNCAYDRIVVAGLKIREFIYKESAQPFYFDEVFGITDQELIKDVSDHYSVEIMLKGSVDKEVTAAISSTDTAITVKFAATPIEIAYMTGQPDATNFCFDGGLDLQVVTWTTESIANALKSLEAYSMRNSVKNLAKAVAVIAYKVERGVLQDISLYGDDTLSDTSTITLLCYKLKGSCTLIMSTSTYIN